MNSKKELVQIAGDPVVRQNGILDATGRVRGQAQGVNFVKTAYGRPWVKVPHWTGQDAWLEVDVYRVPGEPMHIHLICPKCRNSLRITADRKQIRYSKYGVPAIAKELRGINPDVDPGGTLNVERFSCTWEEDGDLRRGIGKLGLCGWTVSIIDNVARA